VGAVDGLVRVARMALDCLCQYPVSALGFVCDCFAINDNVSQSIRYAHMGCPSKIFVPETFACGTSGASWAVEYSDSPQGDGRLFTPSGNVAMGGQAKSVVSSARIIS